MASSMSPPLRVRSIAYRFDRVASAADAVLRLHAAGALAKVLATSILAGGVAVAGAPSPTASVVATPHASAYASFAVPRTLALQLVPGADSLRQIQHRPVPRVSDSGAPMSDQ